MPGTDRYFEGIDLLVYRPESLVDLASSRRAAESRFERLQILKTPGGAGTSSATSRAFEEVLAYGPFISVGGYVWFSLHTVVDIGWRGSPPSRQLGK